MILKSESKAILPLKRRSAARLSIHPSRAMSLGLCNGSNKENRSVVLPKGNRSAGNLATRLVSDWQWPVLSASPEPPKILTRKETNTVKSGMLLNMTWMITPLNAQRHSSLLPWPLLWRHFGWTCTDVPYNTQHESTLHNGKKNTGITWDLSISHS